MAITKIHPIEVTLNKALDYIEDSKKTDEKMLCTGYCCEPEIATQQFDSVRKHAGKEGGYLAFHLIQSFSPGEVDFDTAHQIGIELADKLLKGKYQYVVSTHIDKGNVHNHIIFNSVSFKDYKKYNSSPSSYYFIRRLSDSLCKEHGLSVISEPKEKGISHYEHTQRVQGKSWKQLLRETIDKSVIKAREWDEFLELMKQQNYEIKDGKHIAFRAEGQERFIRSKSLGTDYTEEQLRNRIAGAKRIDTSRDNSISLMIDIETAFKNIQGNTAGLEHWAVLQNLKNAAKTYNYIVENNLDYDSFSAKLDACKTKSDDCRKRIKDIEKRIKEIDELAKNIDDFRTNKPVADKLDTVVFKDKFRREHESELIIYTAAKKYLDKKIKGGKLPLIRSLRAEQKGLTAEKDKLYEEYHKAKSELSELETVKKNLDTLLGRDISLEREQRKKHSGELE
jgi:hypothetical protein